MATKAGREARTASGANAAGGQMARGLEKAAAREKARGMEKTYHLYPRWAKIAWDLALVLTVLPLAVWGIVGALRLGGGGKVIAEPPPVLTVVWILLLGGVGAGYISAKMWQHACTVTAEGIVDRNPLGARRHIPWGQMTSVQTERERGRLVTTIARARAGGLFPLTFRHFVRLGNPDLARFLSALADSPVAARFDLSTRTLASLREVAVKDIDLKAAHGGVSEQPEPSAKHEALARGALGVAARSARRVWRDDVASAEDLVQIEYVLQSRAVVTCREVLDAFPSSELTHYFLASAYLQAHRPRRLDSPSVKPQVPREALAAARSEFEKLVASERFGTQARSALDDIRKAIDARRAESPAVEASLTHVGPLGYAAVAVLLLPMAYAVALSLAVTMPLWLKAALIGGPAGFGLVLIGMGTQRLLRGDIADARTPPRTLVAVGIATVALSALIPVVLR